MRGSSIVTAARSRNLRRFFEKGIEVVALAAPRWATWALGKLEYANVDSGELGSVADAALIAYSTPRVPQDQLAEPLRAAGIVVRVGDCALPQGLLAATADGYALGMAL